MLVGTFSLANNTYILFGLSVQIVSTIISIKLSGRGAVRRARLHGVQEVQGSNPCAPTEECLLIVKITNILFIFFSLFWSIFPLILNSENPGLQIYTFPIASR